MRADKRLGQHFLVDAGVIDRIVACIAPCAGQSLLEIGPGLGALTFPVLEKSGTLTAIELDKRVLMRIQEKAQSLGVLTLINKDVLQVDFATISSAPLRVFGNLPYNVSTPILFHCLAQRHLINDMHFMLQKEVTARMIASPGGREYGRLSVMLQRYFSITHLLDVPPNAFDPPPQVDSAVVRIVRHDEPPYQVTSEAIFAEIVKTAFSQRRKMLRKSLASYIDSDALIELDIDPQARAETLPGEAFARISNAVVSR